MRRHTRIARDQFAFHLHYSEGMTYWEIGYFFGVTRERAREYVDRWSRRVVSYQEAKLAKTLGITVVEVRNLRRLFDQTDLFKDELSPKKQRISRRLTPRKKEKGWYENLAI